MPRDDDQASAHAHHRDAGGTQKGSSFGADRFSSTDAAQVSFFRNRAYDQNTGRGLQEDPIGVAGGLNLYQFNGNNPVSYTDPFGLCPPVESCILLGALAASGKKTLTLKTFATGDKETVRGFDVTARRPTQVTVSKSETTGNAVVSVVGELSVDIPGPNAEVTAASYDIGTGQGEAHGHYDIPLGQLLLPLHVKGDKDKGITGACVIICFPVQ